MLRLERASSALRFLTAVISTVVDRMSTSMDSKLDSPHSLKREAVQGVLNAFLGVFTQPFEQDLGASVKAAATSISLAGLLAVLVDTGRQTALEFGRSSLVLVLIWMAVTAVVGKVDRRRLTIARNLSVVSFWIAVTLVLVIAVGLVFPDPLDRAIRLASVWGALLVLVLVYVIRIRLSVGPAALMILALWVSAGGLAWLALS